MRRVVTASLLALSLVAPAAAVAAAPELSATSRLDDRRYAATGPRAYDVGTEAGRYPAMGFHTRGEMGGIWAPPVKLLDGLWFGLDDQWIGPAEKFTTGYGHVSMALPGRPGLIVTRTDFVPGNARGVLVGLSFSSSGGEQTFRLKVDAHSELMSIYPWGETTPSQTVFNLPDTAAYDDAGGALLFTDQGTPPVANAPAHDWAVAVGSARTPVEHRTGAGFRGPQDDPPGPVICPATGDAPKRCDDTAYGKGAGGELAYDITVPAGGRTDVWFGVGGSETGAGGARAQLASLLDDPAGKLEAKVAERQSLADRTRLSLPGDPRLADAIAWSKQNLADSVQDVRGLQLREVNAGKDYPAPIGTLDRARFLGAGFPDYPWLFATDGEYTAFASVALGQFGPIEDHLRALRDASRIVNGDSGKVIHEVNDEGSVYFGTLADPGNTDETAKFPSAVALLWRWTGDAGFLGEMYDFTRANMHYIVDKLDADGDGWPEGMGNVERMGMGEEKLDNTVYTIRGLWDLADMAAARGDVGTRRWAAGHARDLQRRFEAAWWMPVVPGYADSLDDPAPGAPGPRDVQLYQRHWIGVTPTEVELTRGGRALPGLASAPHAATTLDVHERACYGDASGLFHTGAPGCDGAPKSPSEKQSFTLNTSIISAGEGNYGRLGAGRQQRWTKALVDQQLPGVEQPGAMPEVASPSPQDGDILNRPFNERPMVQQAWGNYGTAWPVVHQQLGVRPDLGRGRLEVVPQLPGSGPISGRDIRLGDLGSLDVSARRDSAGRYVTTVGAYARVALRIGQTLPAGSAVRDVRLNGRRVAAHESRETNRGLEVTVRAAPGEVETLTVRAR
jgi:hypothetical protein